MSIYHCIHTKALSLHIIANIHATAKNRCLRIILQHITTLLEHIIIQS